MRALALCLMLPTLAAQAATLERVVIVERHGVRAPSKSPAELSAYSAQAWPDWPVAPGELTPHGAAGMRLMGDFLRQTYAASGLLPGSACPAPANIFVWADGRDQRTTESGDALLAGMFPGCGLSAVHGPAGLPDPLFDGLETGACKLDPAAAKSNVTAALDTLESDPARKLPRAVAALSELLDPAGLRKTCKAGEDRCFEQGTNIVAASAKAAKVKGPLATGATLAEALMLEYEQGMQGEQLGWGRLDIAKLETIMPLHGMYSGLTRANPAIAGHNGALIAQAVLHAIAGKPGFPGQSGPAPRLTIVLGHDTTLSNLAGIFGLDWTLPGQPDATPPGGALVFEVFQAADPSKQQVKISLLYQSADQLRGLAALDKLSPAGRIALFPKFCPEAGCSVAELETEARQIVPRECWAAKG